MFGDEEGFIAGAELKEIYDQAEMLNDEERNAKYRCASLSSFTASSFEGRGERGEERATRRSPL